MEHYKRKTNTLKKTLRIKMSYKIKIIFKTKEIYLNENNLWTKELKQAAYKEYLIR